MQQRVKGIPFIHVSVLLYADALKFVLEYLVRLSGISKHFQIGVDNYFFWCTCNDKLFSTLWIEGVDSCNNHY